MIGGLFGDLAADTYLRDKKTFFSQLFDEQATLSQYGRAILAQSAVLADEREFTSDLAVSEYRRCNVDLTDFDDMLDRRKLGAVLYATSAWWKDEVFDGRDDCFAPSWFEKEEGYFHLFINIIIPELLRGATKDEVYSQLGDVFKGIRHDWQWKTNEGAMLSYLLRAWDCFYNSFDFGSAIHNAVKCVGDVRLNATLTGMIAEAMYGCSHYFIKKKFAVNGEFVHYLQLPERIADTYHSQLAAIKQQERWQDFFFKKNEAMTNVEWHNFTPIKNNFADKVISPELHRRILKAFGTSWEARYGFYLDDGWVYIYRSHFLIGRFRMKKLHDGTFRIIDTQESGENKDFDIALGDGALHTAEFCWDQEGPFRFRYYHFYNGKQSDSQCPYPTDSIKGKFWFGEKMFYETQMKRIGKWLHEGRESLHSLRDPKLYAIAKRLGPESFAVQYFINDLFDKWNPMSVNDWVLEY